MLDTGNNDRFQIVVAQRSAGEDSIMGLLGSRPSSRMLAVFALVATTALWGASYPMIKQLIDVFPPCTLGVLRLAIALAVLLPVLVIKGGRPHFGRASVLLGITGVGAFQLLQNYGMERMPAGSAVIVLFGSAVVFTTVLGWVLLGEACSTPMVVALLGSGAGVVLVTIGSGGQIGFPLVGSGVDPGVGAGVVDVRDHRAESDGRGRPERDQCGRADRGAGADASLRGV